MEFVFGLVLFVVFGDVSGKGVDLNENLFVFVVVFNFYLVDFFWCGVWIDLGFVFWDWVIDVLCGCWVGRF